MLEGRSSYYQDETGKNDVCLVNRAFWGDEVVAYTEEGNVIALAADHREEITKWAGEIGCEITWACRI